jgi:hypothetical protein
VAARTLADLLCESGVADETEIRAAARRARQEGTSLVRALLAEGRLGEVELLETLARRLKVPQIDPATAFVEPDAVREVAYDLAVARCLLPLALERQAGRRVLRVAMADPLDRETIAELESSTGCRVDVVLAAPSALEPAIERAYRGMVTKMIRQRGGREPGPATDLPEVATEPSYRIEDDAPLELRLRALVTLLIDKGLLSEPEYREAVRRLLDGDRQE